MHDILVSVIIPVYNVEKFLRQCVDSVLVQTYYNLEILLVDDGSPDSSGTICDEYAAKDSRVKVIHQENGGLSAARNSGLDQATGRYVTFVDSDDMIHDRYVEFLLKMITDNDADVSCIGFKEFINDSEVNTTEISVKPIHTADNISYLRQLLYQTTGQPSAWGKMYRRELFADERYRVGIWYEDLDIIYRILLKAHNVAWSDTGLYFYRKNPESILHTFSARRQDVLDVTDRMVEYINAHCPELSMAARSRRLSAHFNIYCILAAGKMNEKEIEERCLNVIREERSNFVAHPHIRLKNRIGILITYIGGFGLLRRVAKRIY